MEISKIKIPSGNSTVTLDIKDTVARESIPEMPDLSGGHDYVEIAGIKWATMNIGAESITDTGLYFQWGDTSGYTASQCGSDSGQKYFGWTDYKYGNGTDNPGAIGMTKYNSSDGKTVLELSDDAAQTNWGGAWRMPTTADFQALGNAVNTVWTADYQGSGVAGLVLTDKTDSSKVLFFPAASRGYYGGVRDVGSSGFYWSSSVLNSDAQGAYCLYFYNSGVRWQSYNNRYSGFSVRGVLDTSNLLHKVAVTGDYNDLENKLSNATTSTAGLMSSTDKSKLDGIEAQALKHIAPTPAEVKTALGVTLNGERFLREDGTWQASNGSGGAHAEYQGATLIFTDSGSFNNTTLTI